jgi:D-alanyl-D-alanine carboxypeptidase/D-alanyl-D-alanine-endopeptidase (penicillin-binding protein 4)
MEATEGRLRAKTGTLEGVTSLSGYVETAARDRLVFSVLVNDYPGRAHLSVRAVDAVGNALAAAGGKASELGAAVASAVPPPSQPGESADDVKAHLATYYQLGRSGDRRNIPFLRTSLKGERDPVLRIAAAEAVYLSDPDSQSARRAFLDAVAADGASFPRLRSLSGGEAMEAPGPVLGSLANLAAEGGADALLRLVELSPAALADPALTRPVAEIWEEVARDVPDEALGALREATPPSAEAALGAIARGIAATNDTDHPFPAAVRRAEHDADPDVAAHARALGIRLDAALGAARAVLKAGPPPTIGPTAADANRN